MPAYEGESPAETRLDRLETVLERLIETTEKRMGQVETALERLTEAQILTEKRLTKLTQNVGALGKTVGYGLEGIARVILPSYLERRHGIRVDGLQRKVFSIGKQEHELDLYGEGRRHGRKIVVLGEVKSRISKREVRQFAYLVKRLEQQLNGEVFKLMFGYYIHRGGSEEAKRQGIELI